MWEVFQVFQPKLEKQKHTSRGRAMSRRVPGHPLPSSVKHSMNWAPSWPCRLVQMRVHLRHSAGCLVSSSQGAATLEQKRQRSTEPRCSVCPHSSVSLFLKVLGGERKEGGGITFSTQRDLERSLIPDTLPRSPLHHSLVLLFHWWVWPKPAI